MGYTGQKILAVVLWAVFVGVILGLTAVLLAGQKTDMGETGQVVGGFFVFLPTLVLAYRLWTIHKFQHRDYQWFAAKYPQCVRDGGEICPKCGGTDVAVHTHPRESLAREHSCRKCGATLYYSPEQ